MRNRKDRHSPEYFQRRRATKQAVLSSFKLTVGCAVCGYAEAADALEMDHVLPLNGESRPFSNHTTSWAKLWRFLLSPNMQVLCANHHAIKSAEERRARLAVAHA